MSEWNKDGRTAPRDGRWLLVRDENGRVGLGRWEPTVWPLGKQQLTYEWRVFDSSCAYPTDPDDEWDWWCDYVVDAWKPLPASAIEAASADKTAQTGLAEGESAAPNGGDAHA